MLARCAQALQLFSSSQLGSSALPLNQVLRQFGNNAATTGKQWHWMVSQGHKINPCNSMVRRVQTSGPQSPWHQCSTRALCLGTLALHLFAWPVQLQAASQGAAACHTCLSVSTYQVQQRSSCTLHIRLGVRACCSCARGVHSLKLW